MVRSNLIPATLLLVASSCCFAGAMGPVSSMPENDFYVDGQAAYTWSSLGGFSFLTEKISPDYNGWGGRLGFGARHPISERWRIFGEVGGGYYDNGRLGFGQTDRFKIDFYGFDTVVGLDYRYQNIDLFGGVGAMIESMRVRTAVSSSFFPSGSSVTIDQSRDITDTTSVATPEVKVGGIYNINQNLGVSLAYTYLWGETMSLTNRATLGVPNLHASSSVAVLKPVQKDILLFGLRYTFA